MDDATTRLHRRLRDCFEANFPQAEGMAEAQLTTEALPGWDSVATLMLVSLVEEEFSISIGYDRLQELTSFQAFADMVAARLK